ncbi:MAG: SoxR reducing system RseC family protein [Planctomycetes bacterium]|nr:SoxR reducing system RseC family protein [Planctomycetota bacterium]
MKKAGRNPAKPERKPDLDAELITKRGCVSAVGDSAVEIQLCGPEGACAECGMCEGAGKRDRRITVRRSANLEFGRMVKVTFPYRSVWTPVFFVFILPLMLFFAFLAAASGVVSAARVDDTLGTAVVGISALVGLTVGLWISFAYERRFRQRIFEETIVDVDNDACPA